MNEFDPSGAQSKAESESRTAPTSIPGSVAHESAFHSQLEYLSQQQPYLQQDGRSFPQQAFDMGSMASALPQLGMPQMIPRGQYAPSDAPGMFSSGSVYQMQQASQYAMGRGSHFDQASASRVQQYPFLASPYDSLPPQAQMASRQSIPSHPHAQYQQFDLYSYGYNAPHVPTLDPRFASHGHFGMISNMQGDQSQYSRRASEPAMVPSYPRGPPRKPKQSGHALWVGNLPPAATVTDLKDHFSRDATKDIESLFLISKSSCAFVNYRSEAACNAAMHRFHDSRFHGVRLVCRLRRGTNSGSIVMPILSGDASETPSSNDSPAGAASPTVLEEPMSPTIVGSITESLQATTSGDSNEQSPRVTDKYFIVKSLTVQDLESSVRNGTWATQSHNEATLNRAFDEADNVYLIFSANKSGEYFGYARMASAISGEPVHLSSSTASEEQYTPGAPQSIPTPATATAPRGRIIDDSARGTIFWEAELSDEDDEESPVKDSGEGSDGQNWGRQFAIEWLSAARLPFYRTRGLRNPLNANREVKIARDGTELEASVGRRLVQMFQRPSPGLQPPQPGMPFR